MRDWANRAGGATGPVEPKRWPNGPMESEAVLGRGTNGPIEPGALLGNRAAGAIEPVEPEGSSKKNINGF